MNYKHVSITADLPTREILIALLADIGFEGFDEQDDAILNAYITETDFNEEVLREILTTMELEPTINDIQKTNWNKEWESNFQPVYVEDFCTIRADFHEPDPKAKHEIIITPKMSFGTGHHATTQLMIRMMKELDFSYKSILDFGTGTGVLAILASFLGAGSVLGIDNDEWSFENARENVSRNGVDVAITMDDITSLNHEFDIILANINRHILLAHMRDLYRKLGNDGWLMMSGLLTEDKSVMVESAMKTGFQLVKENVLNNWIVLLFRK